jgi:hypothetical protein
MSDNAPTLTDPVAPTLTDPVAPLPPLPSPRDVAELAVKYEGFKGRDRETGEQPEATA